MKIGILTLPLHVNYGGILQAYALQTVLGRMGHDVVVFDTDKRLCVPKSPLTYAKRILAKLFKGNSIPVFYEKKKNESYPIVSKYTQHFIDKYVNRYIVNHLGNIKENEFDAIIVGSDQIWRPIYFRSPVWTKTEDAFLAFTKGWDIKRISYAASFGVEHKEYTDKELIKCREALEKFDAVSVREDVAITQCFEYFGIKAKHVLDPTMLLDKEDYIALIQHENEPQSVGTLFEYILDINSEKMEIVDKISHEMDLRRFAVKPVDKGKPEERIYPSVTTWLRAFMDADFVVCDSFHGAVFSIIFNKPFLVIGNAKRGMARFTSLLKMFSLEERMISNINEVDIYRKSIDWNSVNTARMKLQKESKEFLSINLSQTM